MKPKSEWFFEVTTQTSVYQPLTGNPLHAPNPVVVMLTSSPPLPNSTPGGGGGFSSMSEPLYPFSDMRAPTTSLDTGSAGPNWIFSPRIHVEPEQRSINELPKK